MFLLILPFTIKEVNAFKNDVNTDEMILSFHDVEYAVSVTNGNNTLLVELLIEKGKNNYVEKQTNFIYNAYSESTNTIYGDQYNLFGRTLTGSEISLLITHPFHISDWVNAGSKALEKTAELYTSRSDGSIGNSFQHSYWNVLMVKNMGVSLAKKFADAHEDFDGNPIVHKEMDLYNNEIGRDFAVSLSNLNDLSDDALAIQTQPLVQEGQLLYILFEYKYIYKMIIYIDRVDFIYKYGDFHAYTNKLTPISEPPIIIVDARDRPGPIPLPEFIGDIIYE